jgi:cell division protein FtsI/penicillin-binding protein 2
MKPFTLSLLHSLSLLRSDEEFTCPEKLMLAGHRVDCSHPRMAAPMRVETALAYSCNCYVANAAKRFAPGELARSVARFGLAISPRAGEQQQLQAIGEGDIAVTPLQLAQAYASLARPADEKIRKGLEGAVDYGTAQLARVSWAQLAGKTGSTRQGSQPIAWFAGFIPSRDPRLAISVLLAAGHGGSDAAPVAGRILEDSRNLIRGNA